MIIVAALALTLASCERIDEQSLIGKWKNHSTVLGVVTETTYEFRENMTGTRSTLLGVDLEFDYSFSEEELIITTTLFGLAKSERYAYEVKGDVLTLTDKDGKTVEYTACE